MSMIRTTDLKKAYMAEEVQTIALDGVSLAIEEKEFVAVMGPSGCGKSTLLNVLGLLDAPSSGRYELMGTHIERYGERERLKLRKGTVGFVFQSFNLIDELSVYENVELPLLYLRTSTSERRRRVGTVLERVGLSHRMKHFPNQLSGGQQQRVAVARAVVSNPRLIMADEPTGNLDSANGEQVMSLLEELNADGTTIVMVTHSTAQAEYANRIVHLFDGKIVSETSAEVVDA